MSKLETSKGNALKTKAASTDKKSFSPKQNKLPVKIFGKKKYKKNFPAEIEKKQRNQGAIKMTNAMPMLINSLFPFMTKNLDSNAKTMIETARKTFAAAAEETNFGDIAGSRMIESSGESNKNLAAIAVWHYSRGVKMFRQAIGQFDQAAQRDLPAKYKKYVDSKIKDCLSRANAAYLQQLDAEKLLK